MLYPAGMKRKQSYQQAMASQRNLAKARHASKQAAQARRDAAAAQAAKTPERLAWEAAYADALAAYKANPCLETFQPLNQLRADVPS